MQLSAAIIAMLSHCAAQTYREREFRAGCDQVEKAARAYLDSRGFTQPECDHCPDSLKSSPGRLLDSHGKMVGTARMRRELAVLPVPFYIWSDALHARVFLWPKPRASGCKLGLYIDFASSHTMIIGIIPSGERLGIPSNGKLEIEYLDALASENH